MLLKWGLITQRGGGANTLSVTCPQGQIRWGWGGGGIRCDTGYHVDFRD